MGMTVFICIIAFSIIWPVGMIVLKAYSGDVRVAGYVLEEKGSAFLNTTSGKIHPELRTPHPQLKSLSLSQAVKKRATFYTPGSDMISLRDTFNTWGLIIAPLKPQ
jgi:hypothetical protein